MRRIVAGLRVLAALLSPLVARAQPAACGDDL